MLPDFDRICRLCMAKNDNMVSIFGEIGETRQRLSERIEHCVCLKVSESDGLPAAVCSECLKKLDQIKKFKDHCVQTDTLLRQYLHAAESFGNSSKITEMTSGQGRGHGSKMKQNSTFKNKRKKENPSDFESDNSIEEDISSKAASTGLLFKQEPGVHVKQEVACNIPRPARRGLKKRTKTHDAKYQIVNGEEEDNEDNEHVWPGSLSDDELELNHSKEQHTDSIGKGGNGGQTDGLRKRTRSQRSYECEYCGRVFPRSNHLAQHELTHTKDKPFHCSYCEKSFWYKNSLIGHIKQTHTGDVNFTCEECGKGFFQRSEFNRHKPIHSAETPFKCSECGMAFKLVKNLRRHEKVHTGLRTHTCQYCGKSFRMLQTLRVHLILHTGEKPFKCTYCGKGFSQSAPLKAHTRMHTGERPYMCNFCGGAFPTGSALKAHTFKHTGIHPNSCKDCSVVFKRKRDLIEHCEQVHDGAVTEPVQVTPLLPQDPPCITEKPQEETYEPSSHTSMQQQIPPLRHAAQTHSLPQPDPPHLIGPVVHAHDEMRTMDNISYT